MDAAPSALRIMAAIGLAVGAIGVAPLLAPGAVRRRLGLRDTEQMGYVLRIAGAMLVAGGLILITFATVYWQAIR